MELATVFALWKRRKMSHAVAKEQMMLCRSRGTKAFIAEVDYHAAWERAKRQAALRELLTSLIRMRPFKTLPTVVEWQSERARLFGSATRFKFLVLNGDTRFGKTSFAKHVYGPDHSLVVPCQNVSEPYLKDLKDHHKVIIFDEASPAMVVSNKALFQAGLDPVILSQSRCQDYAYSIWVYGLPMIVCTNDWQVPGAVSSHDRKWLDGNSVCIDVTEPMWMEHQPLQDL